MLDDFLTILSKKNVPHDSTKNDTNTMLTILNILLLIIKCFQQLHEVGTVIISILTMRAVKHRG